MYSERQLRARKSIKKRTNKCKPPVDPKCWFGGAVDPLHRGGTIPWFDIDLSLPPKPRWATVAKAYQGAFCAVIENNEGIFRALQQLPRCLSRLVLRTLPEEYRKEVAALAELLDVPVALLALLQLIYEVFSLTEMAGGLGCTTAIKSCADGAVHARTLDWSWLQGLEALLVNLTVWSGSVKLYQCTSFVGFVGVLTGMRLRPQAGSFSVTLNYRRPFCGVWKANEPSLAIPPLWRNGHVAAALLHALRSGWSIPALLRHALEECGSFQEAVALLRSARVLAPAFIAVAGGTEGLILSRDGGCGCHEQWLEAESLLAVANLDPFGAELPGPRQAPGLIAKDVCQGESLLRRDFMLRFAATEDSSEASAAIEALHSLLTVPPLANEVTLHVTVMCAARGYFASEFSRGPRLLSDVRWDEENYFARICCYGSCRRRTAIASLGGTCAWESSIRRRGGGYFCNHHIPLSLTDISVG